MNLTTKKWAVRWMMAFTLPLDLSLWTETSFPFRSMPEFKRAGAGMKVSTDDSVGGHALLAPKKHRPFRMDSTLSFEWRVQRFPNSEPKIPLRKIDDDHPIRIGLLLSSDESQIPLPGNLVALLKKENTKISRFIFYVPKAGIKKVECGQSPYSTRGLTCLTPGSSDWRKIQVKPAEHLKKWIPGFSAEKFSLTGFWLFADSDNSDSKTQAEFRKIEWKN